MILSNAPGRFRGWVVLVLALSFLSGVPASGQRSSRRADAPLKRQLNTLGGKIRVTRSELRRVRRAEDEIARDLGTVQQRLRQTRESLAMARERMERTGRRQRQLDQELVNTRRRLTDLERSVGLRLAQMYRLGPVRYVSVLLGARTMGEFVGRARFLRTLVSHDARLIAEVMVVRERVAVGKSLVDRQLLQTESAAQDLRQRQREQSGVMALRRDLLVEAKDRRREIERELAELEQDSRAIERRLRAFGRTAEGRRRQGMRYRGGFVAPAEGPVVSGFGMRFHPILRRNQMHRGIDIAAGQGAPIMAVASGTVVYAGWERGYGKVVIIDHGGGFSTTYAHCSELLVTGGRAVRKGQRIARVGATGVATGPHLHFEVRRDGVAIPPSSFR